MDFDTYGIYGANIHVLFSGIFKSNPHYFHAVMIAMKVGLIDIKNVYLAINAAGEKNDFSNYLDIEDTFKKVNQIFSLEG